MMRQDFISLGFNTDDLKPDAAPRSHQDLLDPKWQGRIGISATISSIVTWVGALVVSEGEGFVRKLGAQIGGSIPWAAARSAISLSRARRPSWPTTAARTCMRAPGRVRMSPGGHSALLHLGERRRMAARAKDPHAAMLFVDFLLGPEAQAIYTKELGYASLRLDMPSSDAPQEKLYLTLRRISTANMSNGTTSRTRSSARHARRKMMRLSLLALGLLLALPGPAQAVEGDALAKIALYQGADRQAMLEAAARAEGSLTIYTVGAQIDPLMAAFSAHYPTSPRAC